MDENEDETGPLSASLCLPSTDRRVMFPAPLGELQAPVERRSYWAVHSWLSSCWLCVWGCVWGVGLAGRIEITSSMEKTGISEVSASPRPRSASPPRVCLQLSFLVFRPAFGSSGLWVAGQLTPPRGSQRAVGDMAGEPRVGTSVLSRFTSLLM